MQTLSVIIPAYNEEEGIERITRRVLATREALATAGFALELIVVDDGSSDKTTPVVAQFSEVRLVRHLKNRGYGAAIKTGFRHASGDFLAFLDADATYPPESFPDLCRAITEQKADLVIGSRMIGAKSQMPITRRIGNIAYALLLSLIGNVTVRDTTSGMRVIRRDALARLYPLSDGLDFTPAMSTRAIHENLKIVEVPISYAERVGRSKLSVVRDGFRFTNAIVWTALTYNPVRILGLISLVLLTIAAVIALYILNLRVTGVTALNAGQWIALFVAGTFSFIGTSLFSLGAMFNYLVALFHKTPVRQGLFGKPLFKKPLERHFGWLGLVLMAASLLIGLGALVLGWEIGRLWFYLLGSAFLGIIGVQLSISWVVMRVLDELAQRESAAQHDLVEFEPANVAESMAAAPVRVP